MNPLNQDRLQYIANLLGETLPNKFKNSTQLSQLDIQQTGFYIVLQLSLSNGLIKLINNLTKSNQASWKAIFAQYILKNFSTEILKPITILNLQPFSRTIIISINKNDNHTFTNAHLNKCFASLHTQLIRIYGASVIGCFGSIFQDFFDLGLSYKNARKLQEYSYIIGLGQCAFYDDFSINEDYSLIEYKHIHHFEILLKDRDWIHIYELFDKIKHTIISGTTNNSKTVYLYKEIYALTIRHLFDELGAHKDEIKQLNEGIIMFNHLFDDIHDVHNYYLQILHTISKAELDMPYSLHIKKALHIIHVDYMKALSLDCIAEAANISTAYLSRLFKKEVGMNFKEYLTTYRLNIAKQLLTTTSKDMLTVATSIGYSSSTQFIRTFKSIEGMTPTEYRNYHHS